MAVLEGELPTAVSLTWEGLTRVFPDGSPPLDYGSVKIESGERAVVVGESGSGKTTLLRLLAGLESSTAGRILFDRHEIQQWPAHRRQVAMVSQRPVLYPHLSIRENLRFGGLPRSGEVWGDVDRLAERLGIAGLLDRVPGTLSGGETQRVAVARAFLRRPRVVLLDEPFTHLDADQRQGLREWLMDVHGDWPTTMVLVTHDPAEAWMLGQRLVVLSGRRLHQSGTAQEVWDAPATRAVLGSLSETGVNWLTGRVERTSAGWSFRGDGCEFELTGEALHRWQQVFASGAGNARAGTPVVLGIRPTELTLASALEADRNLGQVTRVDWWGDRRVVQVRWTSRMPTRAADDNGPGSVVRVVTSHHQTVQLGSTVTVQSGSDRLYFFDEQTGQNLQLLSAIASDGKVRQR